LRQRAPWRGSSIRHALRQRPRAGREDLDHLIAPRPHRWACELIALRQHCARPVEAKKVRQENPRTGADHLYGSCRRILALHADGKLRAPGCRPPGHLEVDRLSLVC
jgi:hypothetical protein